MKKFALITGASGGIGKEIALSLAKDGWNIYLHYHQNRNEIEVLMRSLQPFSLEIIPIQADLSSDEGVQKLVSNIFSIDAIVFSSGQAVYGLFQDLSEMELDQLWEVHVKNPIKIVQKLLPKFYRLGHGNIVFISSIWGQTGAACEVMYSTVKGAQLSFVKSLAKETARSGIRINAVAPGAVETHMMSRFSQDELELLTEEIPIGRLAKPYEIANVVSFLLSEKSSYITGQILSVNGGWYT
ncbi:3-oxoacyl-[acyl-carrier protein] reductase [Oikeobacillus pervagus]|uniref:3-oxoacyl-[acyl-carrier protein] reductase n=1 Tax=Oikeobacillus pervagus TaxID=1325931 RepID=A0AAJ1T3L0_9BACI|nr:SDR family oxidoreductase [Oikeobacillus pervagus]MDQ0214220.1 3-oxoacyl-[acyl-carrier protein] reductase [Oikeobacillus pervagus]